MELELMKKKVNELLHEAREAAKSPGAYGLLPDIIQIMEIIQNKLESDQPNFESIVRGAVAFGRVVTDNYHFAESPLGRKLLAFASEIISGSSVSLPGEQRETEPLEEEKTEND